MTTMLYKSPGHFKRSESETFDLCIVDDHEIKAHIKAGWHYNVRDALDAASAPVASGEEAQTEVKSKRGRPRKSEAL